MVSGFSAARLLGDNYYSSGHTMNTGVASFLGFDPPQAAGGLHACACVYTCMFPVHTCVHMHVVINPVDGC